MRDEEEGDGREGIRPLGHFQRGYSTVQRGEKVNRGVRGRRSKEGKDRLCDRFCAVPRCHGSRSGKEGTLSVRLSH